MMKSYLILVLFITQVSSPELNNTLQSTRFGVQFAYDGEPVNFICVTRGSNTLFWESNEYIGSDGFRLEFASIEAVGTNHSVVDKNTTAWLINISNDNGEIILVSRLLITVQSKYPIASITCRNGGMDKKNTIFFEVAGDTYSVCDQQAVCPGDTVTCTCITARSDSHEWRSDVLIGQNNIILGSMSSGETVTRNNSGFFTCVKLIDSYNQNGVVVLKSELTFIPFVPEVSTEVVILTCGNVDLLQSRATIIPMAKMCESTTTTTISKTTLDEASTNSTCICTDCRPNLAVIIASCVILMCIIVIMVVVAITFRQVSCGQRRHRRTFSGNGIIPRRNNPIRTRESERINDLERQLKEKEEQIFHSDEERKNLEKQLEEMVEQISKSNTTVKSQRELLTEKVKMLQKMTAEKKDMDIELSEKEKQIVSLKTQVKKEMDQHQKELNTKNQVIESLSASIKMMQEQSKMDKMVPREDEVLSRNSNNIKSPDDVHRVKAALFKKEQKVNYLEKVVEELLENQDKGTKIDADVTRQDAEL